MNKDLEQLERYLTENGFALLSGAGSEQLRISSTTAGISVIAVVTSDQNRLRIDTELPIRIAPDRLAAMSELCERVNDIVEVGYFIVTYRNRGLKHTSILPIGEGSLDPEMLTSLFHGQMRMNISVVAHVVDLFSKVAVAGLSPEQAFAVLEGKIHSWRGDERIPPGLLELESVSVN